MKFRHFLLTGSCVGAMLCASMLHAETTPAERVAAQLNANGTFYQISDLRTLPAQAKFRFSLLQPKLENASAGWMSIALPHADFKDVLKQIWTQTGFNAIQAYGASSIILSGDGQKEPYFFHNRGVLDYSGDKLPAFLEIVSGPEITLDQFASSIPDNVRLAGSGIIHLDVLYQMIVKNFPLDDQTKTTIMLYTEIAPEEFFQGISGRFEFVALSGDSEMGVLRIPDRGHRLFHLIAKQFGKDAKDLTELDLTQQCSEDLHADSIKLYAKNDQLEVVVGRTTLDVLAEKLKNGQTLKSRADFAKLSAQLPERAVGYSAGIYGDNAQDPALPAADARLTLEALQIQPGSVRSFKNSYSDWNGLPFEVLCNLMESVLAKFDNTMECQNNLKYVYLLLNNYAQEHDGKFPAAMGINGLATLQDASLAEVLKCPDDDSTEIADEDVPLTWANTSYVYYGAPDAAFASNMGLCPLVSEHPVFCHQNGTKLVMLFADGHTEVLKIPAGTESMEALLPVLKTDKKYTNEQAKALQKRLQDLDKMISEVVALEAEE